MKIRLAAFCFLPEKIDRPFHGRSKEGSDYDERSQHAALGAGAG